MCRMLGYAGAPRRMADVVIEPEHDLVRQSFAAREMLHGTVNADGDGLVWYPRIEGRGDAMAPAAVGQHLYTGPAWADPSIQAVARSITAPLFMGQVRNGTDALTAGVTSLQPFVSGRLSMMHNGFVTGFRHRFMRRWRAGLSAEAYASLRGSADSETMFLQMIDRLGGRVPVPIPAPEPGGEEATGNVTAAAPEDTPQPALTDLAAVVAEYATWVLAEVAAAGESTELNLMLSDGERLVATRTSTALPGTSLHLARGHPAAPDGVIIASERLDDDVTWEAISHHHIVEATVHGELTVTPL